MYPNYCGGVPTLVKDFLRKGNFSLPQGTETILVVTYGNNSGASAAIAEGYFRKNAGRGLDAMYGVKMPDNWTPVFDLTDQAAVAEINRQADRQIDAIISQIQAGARGDFVPDQLGASMKLIHPLMYHVLRKTSHLRVGNGCVGCGLCVRQCPVGAMELREGRPVWVKDRCVMCLGCLHRCPKFAIQYDNTTQNHGQYLHPEGSSPSFL